MKSFWIALARSKLNDEEIDTLLYECVDPLQRCILNLQKNLILSKFGMTVHRLVKSRYSEQDINNPTSYDSGEVMYNHDLVIDYNGELADIHHHYVENRHVRITKIYRRKKKYCMEKTFAIPQQRYKEIFSTKHKIFQG